MTEESSSLDDLVKEFAALWNRGVSPAMGQFLERVPEEQQAEAARLLIAVMVEGRLPTAGTQGLKVESKLSPGFEGTPVSAFEKADELVSRKGTANDNSVLLTQAQTIGPYRLVQKLGEGGMGEVWMAEQQQPVRRPVALKLIRKGMDNDQVIARFEAEKQALAMMDHQNIARVFDAGTTSSGQPYFVMELVNGVSLTKFCDDNKLSIEGRLRLFIDVCSGVQHAHQKGIIHRDLKPGNIVVGYQDGKPVPKVIDFGLAKATENTHRLTDQSLFTDIGQILGTLKYMSPEQASLNNLDIDTRTDIYALGVILYELLTGSTPLDDSTIKGQAALKLLELIREKEPVKPSSRLVNSTNEEVSSITNDRCTDSARLNRILAGDLDWIVMKALDKDRKRRYETASGFAADVHRYLNSEPVNARPPSVSYRIQKFVRKHRVGVVAASLVVLTLIGGIVGTGLSLIRAMKAEQTSEARRQEAETNLAFARKGNEILGSVFVNLDPNAEYYEVSDLRNALHDNLTQAVRELQESALGDPLEIANLQETLGDSLLSLGDSSNAIELFQRSLEIHSDRLGIDHPDTLTSLESLARGYFKTGELEKAQPMLEQVVERRKATLGAEHEETLGSLNNLAECYRSAGQLDKALPLLEQILDSINVKPAVKQSAKLLSMSNLGMAYIEDGQMDRGLVLLEQVLDLRKAELGDEHLETLTSMANLAAGYFTVGQVDKALTLSEKNVERLSAQLGLDHPFTMTGIANLAHIYQSVGQADKSLPLLEQVLKLRTAKLGAEHPQTLIAMSNLAEIYFSLGQLEKALPMFHQTLESRKTRLGVDHPDTLGSMNSLAVVYNNSPGQREKALVLYDQALELSKTRLGAENPATLLTMHNFAACCQAAGQADKAQALFEETLALRKAKLGLHHPETLSTMNHLAEVYRKARRFDQAAELQQETLKLRESTLGPDHPNTINSMNNLAVTYRDAGRFEIALPLFQKSLELKKARLGADHESTLASMNNLGAGYSDLGQLDKAIPLLEQTLELMKARFGANHSSLLSTQNQLLMAYAKAGQVDKHSQMLDASISQWRASFPENSDELAVPLSTAGLTLLQLNQFSKAEELLRECLRIRQVTQPDLWNTFYVQALLGNALKGQAEAVKDESEKKQRLTEAESLLLAGYQGMKQREASIPPAGMTRIPETLNYLIELYTVLEKPDEVQKFRKLQAAYPPAAQK